MTNPVRLLFLGLLIALAAFAYKVNVERFSPGSSSVKPIYAANFNTVVSMGKDGEGHLTDIGRCMKYSSKFKYYKDSVTMKLEDKPNTKYTVLGIDEAGGLHVLKSDSTQLVFYRVEDPRPQYRSLGDTCVLMVDNYHQLAFLLSTSKKCE